MIYGYIKKVLNKILGNLVLNELQWYYIVMHFLKYDKSKCSVFKLKKVRMI